MDFDRVPLSSSETSADDS